LKNNKCKIEVYSRVTGFYRPVQSWNKGKKSEFKGRETYKIPPSEVTNEKELHS